MSDEVILGQNIRKNSRDEIRVSLAIFRGRDLLDIRTFSERRDLQERVPTPKDISLKVGQLDELINALE